MSFLGIDNPLKYYLVFRGLFSVDTTARILGSSEKWVKDVLKKVYLEDSYEISRKNFVSLLESDLYMKNQLLRDTDFMSMWHSVETRVPFLDKELMNFVFSINESVKFRDKIPKSFLKNAFNDIFTSEIITRPKMGFTFPFDIWIKNNIRMFADFLPGSKEIRTLLENFAKGKLNWSRFWALVVIFKC